MADHLAVCEACRVDLLQFEQVVAVLPLAVAQSQPPPELKQAVMRSVQAQAARSEKATRPSLMDRLADLGRRRALAWSWTSLALILVLAVSNLLLWGRLRQLEAPATNALQVVILNGTGFTPQATGSMVIGRDGLVGTLVVDGLPALDESQQYQLWFIQDSERVSGGVFSVSDEGYGSLYIHAPQPVESFTGLGVTIEPAGGSPQPTGDRVLGADL